MGAGFFGISLVGVFVVSFGILFVFLAYRMGYSGWSRWNKEEQKKVGMLFGILGVF